jgi:ribosome-associated toxin RatA of RatAB toxin-antitoxin module
LAENNPSRKFGEAERDLLAKGEIIVFDTSGGDAKGMVEAAVLIHTPAEQVWNVMVDCHGAPEFVPGLKNCKVLQRGGDTETIEHQVKFSWLIPEVTYTFKANYHMHKRIDFKRTEGDLKELEGSWVLESVDDGRKTIIIYSVYLDPGFFVPQWLVRFILRRDLPELLLSIRNRVSLLYGQ